MSYHFKGRNETKYHRHYFFPYNGCNNISFQWKLSPSPLKNVGAWDDCVDILNMEHFNWQTLSDTFRLQWRYGDSHFHPQKFLITSPFALRHSNSALKIHGTFPFYCRIIKARNSLQKFSGNSMERRWRWNRDEKWSRHWKKSNYTAWHTIIQEWISRIYWRLRIHAQRNDTKTHTHTHIHTHTHTHTR